MTKRTSNNGTRCLELDRGIEVYPAEGGGLFFDDPLDDADNFEISAEDIDWLLADDSEPAQRPIWRCKRRKNQPGDGGIVDGCGWQGPAPASGRCPECGSPYARPLNTNPTGQAPVKEPPK